MAEATANMIAESDPLISAFVTNLGKYNAGSLCGEWVPLPTTADELAKVFDRIGIDGDTYEEYFITDYDINVVGIADHLDEFENLDELNYLAAKLEDMAQCEVEQLEAALQYGEISGIREIINLLEGNNLADCYDFIPEIDDDSDLGYYWVEESGCYDTKSMGSLSNYIDYERFGRDIRLEEGGTFVSPRGYVRATGDSPSELYEGEVPDEYTVLPHGGGELSAHEGNVLMTVLVVKPGEAPLEAKIARGLESLQSIVGGRIQAVYPYEDPVALICNEEGKINGLPLNRALYDDCGDVFDLVAGNFVVCGLGAESFGPLSAELLDKYREMFKDPEDFVRIAGKILAVKHPVGIIAAHELGEKTKPGHADPEH